MLCLVERPVLCTLDELTELVEDALAVDYAGAPTGRVRDVPDRRAIRWYVTRGLVDRPAATRGRVALYGRRHLLQLVAIKRRQADGRSLAEIQAELAGATDDVLAGVARLPRPGGAAPVASSAAVAGDPAERGVAGNGPAGDGRPDGGGNRAGPARSRFWTDRPGEWRPAAVPESPVMAPPAATEAAIGDALGTGDGPAFQGIRLAPGVILLVESGLAPPNELSGAALRAAARPLLDLLAAGRQALDPGPASGDPTRSEP